MKRNTELELALKRELWVNPHEAGYAEHIEELRILERMLLADGESVFLVPPFGDAPASYDNLWSTPGGWKLDKHWERRLEQMHNISQGMMPDGRNWRQDNYKPNPLNI